MRIASDAEEDRAAEVMPVPPRVASVKALPNFALEVTFSDGLRGKVECERLVLGARAGVFARLRDPGVFAAARVEMGAVTWPGGLDLAPDAMYDQIERDGHWVLA